MNLYLGIDVGTSSTKAILMDEQGRAVASASREYPLSTPRNGWAEQHPHLWRDAALEAIHELAAGVDAADIKSIGLTGQMHGLVMLDERGEVIRPAILWCDQRTAAECTEITDMIGAARLIELTANPALTGFTAPKILWVRKHEPEHYQRCVKIMLPKDYIRYVLTGVHATDVSDASGTGLLNVGKRAWESEVLMKLGIDLKQLGKLCEAPEITGGILPEVAAVTGLAAGTPVAAGAGDNAAAAIGTGVAREGQAFVTIGSSGVLFAHATTMRLDPKGRVHSFCAAVPGEWHVMGVTLAAGLSLQWLRRNCMPELDYPKLTELAAQSPIGANRLIYLPYLNGERTPHADPNCRAAFVGLAASHGRGDLARAVMEGVSYSLKDCHGVMEEMGVPLRGVTACGGGGASPLWRQMLADLFGAHVRTVQSADAPALGAAMLAAVGVGAFPSVPEACDQLIRPDKNTAPDASRGKDYAKFYAIYRSLYNDLRQSFEALAQL